MESMTLSVRSVAGRGADIVCGSDLVEEGDSRFRDLSTTCYRLLVPFVFWTAFRKIPLFMPFNPGSSNLLIHKSACWTFFPEIVFARGVIFLIFFLFRACYERI